MMMTLQDVFKIKYDVWDPSIFMDEKLQFFDIEEEADAVRQLHCFEQAVFSPIKEWVIEAYLQKMKEKANKESVETAVQSP